MVQRGTRAVLSNEGGSSYIRHMEDYEQINRLIRVRMFILNTAADVRVENEAQQAVEYLVALAAGRPH
jgi:hypothetical protein